MQGHLNPLDYVTVGIYFAMMVGMGVYFSRYMQSARDYFSGGNRLPWWLAGISFYMSGFSAMGIVMYSRIGYEYGLVSMSLMWTVVPGVFLGARFLAHRWRRARIATPVAFLERRYHILIRQLVAWAGLPVKVIDDGMKIYALGTFVSVGLGIPLRFSIVASGLVMLCYTVMGGLWAVTVTDTIQFIVLGAAMVVVLPLALGQVGGIGGLIAGSPEGFFRFLNGPYTPFYYVAFLVLAGMSYNATWSLVQRYYSVRDEREARKVGYLAATLSIFGPPLWILAAMAARQILPGLGATDANELNRVYALLSLKLLPVGMLGVVISAMFAATMSSLDSDYNILSAVITEDVYHRLIAPKASPRRLLWFGRLMTVVIGTIATTVALIILGTGRGDLFAIMVTVFGLALPPTVIPMLSGLLWRKVTWRAALAGFCVGLFSGIFFLVWKEGLMAQYGWSSNTVKAMSILVSVAATLLAMYVTSWFERPEASECREIAAFFEQLERPIAEEEVPAKTVEEGERVPSPFYIVGLMTMGIGGVLVTIGLWTLGGGFGPEINIAVGGGLGVLGYSMFRRSKGERGEE